VDTEIDAGRALLSDFNPDVKPPSPAILKTAAGVLKNAVPGVGDIAGVGLAVEFERMEQGADFNESTEIFTQISTAAISKAGGIGAGLLYLALASNPVGWATAAVITVGAIGTGVMLENTSGEKNIREFWRQVGVR